MFRSGSNETLLNGYSLRAQEDLMALRSLVDNNPEYLLILSSDHGVDEVRADLSLSLSLCLFVCSRWSC